MKRYKKPFRLCREVDGEIVDLMEIDCETIEEALEIYRAAFANNKLAA